VKKKSVKNNKMSAYEWFYNWTLDLINFVDFMNSNDKKTEEEWDEEYNKWSGK
jgi:hypothetical protein